jgi:hypothetical protein
MIGRDLGTDFGGWMLYNILTGGDSMKMGVYRRFDSAAGQMEYSLVNKGTTPTPFHDGRFFSDWKNNMQQPFGASADMRASIAAARQFVFEDYFGFEVTMVGHSKGGAEEVAANAVATCMNAIIFNPATVNLRAYGLNSANYSGSMTAFIVRGDALNNVFGFVSRPIDQVVYLRPYDIKDLLKGRHNEK